MAERPRLTPGQRVLAVRELQAIESQLTQAADWLDDHDETRPASMLLAASRSLLASCYLLKPASEAELLDVIEQLPRR
jgi:hypothetical protein